MGLLHGPGPKPKSSKLPNASPLGKSWSADKAAQQVLDRRARRRTHDQNLHAEVNQLAKELWQARIIAIDPGDRYCGVALFNGGVCIQTVEMSPDELFHLVQQAVDNATVDVIVIENFTLYPDKSGEQTGSEMLTSQAIGAVKWIVRQHNELVDTFAANNGGSAQLGHLVELVLQAAAIKVPTTGHVRHHGIKPVSTKPGGRDHMRDAEIHGLHFIMRGQGLIRGSEQNRTESV